MYVAITGSGKARVIQFREDKRIPGSTKKKTYVIKTLGNYERMLAEDPDVISKLKAEIAQQTKEKKESIAPISIDLPSMNITSPNDVTPSYKFGHALIKQLWETMELDEFFLKNCGKRNAESIAHAIYYLTAHRCEDPASVRSSAFDQIKHAGVEPFSLDVLYDVLGVIANQKDAVIKHLCRFFEKKTDRSGPNAYYDVTTYAFESTRWGELRMFGFSKDHKNNEVQVVMGLLLDNNGMPITYELFAGNTMDQSTLTKSVDNLKSLYKLDKITIVADRGLNSGSNLEFLVGCKHDFVISYTLKRSPETFKELALSNDGWQDTIDSETDKVKHRKKVVDHVLEVKVPIEQDAQDPQVASKKRGRPKKYETKLIPVKIHLTWTAKRAAKDKGDRDRMLERLNKRLDKPYQLKAAIMRGCNQYLQMEVDTKDWAINEDKIAQAERFDGYYAVITNNSELTTDEVSAIYSGLWKIEESFRVLKTDLKARPVFVWSDEHVKGHFVICFIALCIMRYIQYLLEEHVDRSVSACEIMKALKEPTIVVQGEFPNVVVTPIQISQIYLDLAQILHLPTLKTNMTLTKFRACTKLNLAVNLK